MEFQDILTCLEDPEKRKDYILRLKSAGPNSQPVLDLKNSMEGVNMNKTPKNIFETTMSQHTFKYCDPLECFLTFRLVCKPWQNAVETIKFDRFNDYDIFQHHTNHPTFVKKYLQTCEKLKILGHTFDSTEIEWIALGATILDSMKKLNEVVIIKFDGKQFTTEQQSFIEELLKNNNKTLKRIKLSKFLFPIISFPRVTKISLIIGNDISAQQFETNLPQLLKNMENLEIVTLHLFRSNTTGIFQYIGENYPQHCISALNLNTYTYVSCGTMLNYFPLKIVENLVYLNEFQDKKYTNQVEYLQVRIDCDEWNRPYHPADHGWDRYTEIFDQYSKLKQIALHFEDDYSEKIEFTDLPENEQTIWKKRLQYFEKRGIQIVDYHDIVDNEALKLKVAKEVGIKWRFAFR